MHQAMGAPCAAYTFPSASVNALRQLRAGGHSWVQRLVKQ